MSKCVPRTHSRESTHLGYFLVQNEKVLGSHEYYHDKGIFSVFFLPLSGCLLMWDTSDTQLPDFCLEPQCYPIDDDLPSILSVFFSGEACQGL